MILQVVLISPNFPGAEAENRARLEHWCGDARCSVKPLKSRWSKPGLLWGNSIGKLASGCGLGVSSKILKDDKKSEKRIEENNGYFS